MSGDQLDESLAAMGLAYPVPAAPAANPVPNPVPANPLPAPQPDVPPVEVVPRLEDLPAMAEGVLSTDPAAQLKSTTSLRKLLSVEQDPPIQEVINAGLVGPTLVEFLKLKDQPELQFQAAWALTNICTGTSDHTRTVIDWGAIPPLVTMLSSTSDDCCEQAMWALGNIAGDSSQSRNVVLQANAMPALLEKLKLGAKNSMLRNGTWTLSNFCRGKPPPPFEWVSPALPTLAQLVSQQDVEILTDTCWALSYLTDGPNEKIQAVIESGVAMRLVELLMHPSPAVQTAALRTLGNIVTGDDLQTQVVINCSVLPSLLSLCSHEKTGIKKEACWALSNITSGNDAQIQAVIDANIVPKLIHILKTEEFGVKKEAVWAISNLTSGGTPEQIEYAVSQGAIPELCNCLTLDDATIVRVALEGLDNVLKVGAQKPGNPMALTIEEVGGLDKLADLQGHDDHQVYEWSVKILERYFGAVDQDEEFHPVAGAGAGEAPAQPVHYGGGFNFGGDYGGDDEDEDELPVYPVLVAGAGYFDVVDEDEEFDFEEFHPVAGAGAGEAPAQP